MVKYKEYTNAQYEAFLKSDFTNNFGFNEETFADWFMSQAGSGAVRQSYGVTKANLLSTYIPNLKAKLNGGWAMFLMITVTEGGGAGNWLNHYASDTGSTGLACMNADIAYVKQIWSTYYPIARSAPEVMGGANYTPDKAGEDERVYRACGNHSIGNYFMPATLAGNAWVFATKWCLAHQGASAPSVYFGNPYDQIINMIKKAGGNPFTGKGSNKPSNNPGDGAPNNNNNPNNPITLGLSEETKKFIKKAIEGVEIGLQKHAWLFHDKTIYANKNVTVKRTFNNRYKVTLTTDFTKALIDKLSSEKSEANPNDNSTNPNDPSKPDDGKHGAGGGSSTGASNVMGKIYNWAKGQYGKWYDEDGYYGAQCMDFLNAMNRIVLNNHLTTNAPVAKQAYNNPVPSDWKKIPGDPSNDANSAKIWNSLPNGAVVFFTNAGAGHVAIKAGKWADCIQQNYASPNGGVNGGAVKRADISPWIQSGGAGFLGAWVAK